MMTKSLALLLILLVGLPWPVLAQSATAWNELLSVPNGSEIRLLLNSKDSVQGRLVRTDADGLVLMAARSSNPGDPSWVQMTRDERYISRTVVDGVTVVKVSRTYRTAQMPEGDKVRQVVTELGRGARVTLNAPNYVGFRGRIQDIAPRDFTVSAGGRSLVLSYDDIEEIRPSSMSTGQKALIISAVAGGVAVALLMSWLSKVGY